MNLCAIAFMLGCPVANPLVPAIYDSGDFMVAKYASIPESLTPSSPFFGTNPYLSELDTSKLIFTVRLNDRDRIDVHSDGSVNCGPPITEAEAADKAASLGPYTGIYLALWRAYCSEKPASTFERTP